jgi:hypothetical protein
MMPTVTCVACLDEFNDDTRLTPCCGVTVCTGCSGFNELVVTSQTDLPQCIYCHVAINAVAGWDALLVADDVQLLQNQIDRINTAQQQGGQQQVQPPDDQTRRNAAWTHGAYVHGCGSAFAISGGCDIVTCPGCNALVNVTGGQVGTHTYNYQNFFNALRAFGSGTPLGAAATLKADHLIAWNALFLDDLYDTVANGDPNGWLDAMADDPWGPFVAFLRARVLPRPALDTSSLRALYAACSSDPQLYADAHVLQELFQNQEQVEFAETRRRMEIIGRITDQRVKDALQGNLRRQSWWA